MALTIKQDKFAQLIATGASQSDAYRGSYSWEKMTNLTIGNNAYKLMQKPEILERIEELNTKAEKKTILTIQQRKEILSDIARNIAYDKDGKAGYADARGAIDLLNKMDAVYVQKQVIDTTGSVNLFLPIQNKEE